MRLALMSLLMIPLAVGCGGGDGDKPGDDTSSEADTDTDTDTGGDTGGDTGRSALKIALEITRIPHDAPALDDVFVSALVTSAGEPVPGLSLDIDLMHGSMSAVMESSPGIYDFTIYPTQSGEYPFVITHGETSISRTPIVLTGVRSGIGQPIAVPGSFVNTEGYEDGPVVSADGQWLFIQTGPVYFSGIAYFYSAEGCGGSLEDCEATAHADWVFDAVGPYTAPERPGFFDERIVDGQIVHHTSFFGGLDIFSPPTLFYGFERQSDGTYANPFLVAIDDNQEALFNPFGQSVRVNSEDEATYLFSFNDWGGESIDDGSDVFTTTIELGTPNTLGQYTPTAEGFTKEWLDPVPVGFPSDAGTQGNPHLFTRSDGEVDSIWVDNEYNADASLDMFVYSLISGTYPSGTWTDAVHLPEKIDGLSTHEAMPFFTGETLYFHRESSVLSAEYLGGDYALSASWAEPVVVLEAEACGSIGCISVVGEPTIGQIDGSPHLFFVYAVLRAYDGGSFGDINMQIGSVQL